MVSGQSFGSSVVSLACITSMCSVQCFRGGHSLCSAFGLDMWGVFTAFVAFMGRWGCTFGTWVLFSLCMCLHAQHRWVPPGLAYWDSGFSEP